MTKARAFTIAGLVHLAVATLLAMTFLAGQPGTALGSGMVITRTPTPTPHNGNNDHKQCRLTCTKTASRTELSPGDKVEFVIKVCNHGDKKCKDVVGSDLLPAQLQMISPTGIKFEFGDLKKGCVELTIVARVRDGIRLNERFPNVFTVGEKAAIATQVTCQATLICLDLPPSGGNAPQSGEVVPQAVVAGLLVMGAGLLAAGLVLRAKNRVS